LVRKTYTVDYLFIVNEIDYLFIVFKINEGTSNIPSIVYTKKTYFPGKKCLFFPVKKNQILNNFCSRTPIEYQLALQLGVL
jgi:hypothetical protein